ncbi:uncharacterized protein MKK02DRAFT_45712 [Dioszegia hungarica]|uniref:Stress-response A/B barrel domain-containing protein n=1 Tax=Dioszegia hungarica TaxID=4972 RepID=A0AA38LTK2_9TREE|nr:uncharacterized protein MKK02DRAFT_45712 [Dioszegia hungarica]KAI9637002.1 hypothetical protein MKK02DRAFT_45712 [Dioszegia hungarica]
MSPSVFHVCAYKVADPAVIPDLINAIQSVNTSCAKPDGSEYILSVKGGKQMSPEGLDLGVQLVFDKDDLMYYIDEDPAHVAFKTTCVERFGLGGGAVVDFIDGVF